MKSSTVVIIKNIAFCGVMPSSMVEVYQHFRRTCCFNLHTSSWQQVPTEHWWISTKPQGSFHHLHIACFVDTFILSETKSNLLLVWIMQHQMLHSTALQQINSVCHNLEILTWNHTSYYTISIMPIVGTELTTRFIVMQQTQKKPNVCWLCNWGHTHHCKLTLCGLPLFWQCMGVSICMYSKNCTLP
jgi:hypothetical protein